MMISSRKSFCAYIKGLGSLAVLPTKMTRRLYVKELPSCKQSRISGRDDPANHPSTAIHAPFLP